MHYTMTIAGVKRDLPICKVTDDLYIGAFVIFGDVELTVKTAAALLEKAPEYDYMISAEAKGIPLIHEMARQSGQNKVLCRNSRLFQTYSARMQKILRQELSSCAAWLSS